MRRKNNLCKIHRKSISVKRKCAVSLHSDRVYLAALPGRKPTKQKTDKTKPLPARNNACTSLPAANPTETNLYNAKVPAPKPAKAPQQIPKTTGAKPPNENITTKSKQL
ncbi:MAG: hypothetical protein K2N86_04545, partial [Rikenellaceae bacterium]|nr:hypothetical protein [Rikenellaceae bacterium]